MKEIICTFSESYTTEELWLDEDTAQFTIKTYHYGWIDDEEHYDGEKKIGISAALKKIIEYNKLPVALQYGRELHLEQALDAVLAEMKQRGWINNPASFGLLADQHLEYYEISENEHAVYCHKTFFSVKNGSDFSVDFTVVKRILENRDKVIYSNYNHRDNCWEHRKL